MTCGPVLRSFGRLRRWLHRCPWDSAPAATDPAATVSLSLRLELSEGLWVYGRRLLESGLGGPVGATRVRLLRASVISAAPDPEERRRSLLLAGRLLAALEPAVVTSFSAQVDGAVPLAWLAVLVRRLPALRELDLLLLAQGCCFLALCGCPGTLKVT